MPAPSRPARRLTIVAIGTSAGGLEALEQFLTHVPRNSGLAYVVVQHLDPTHKAMLPELLARFTDMRVQEVRGRRVIRPNCVYVIPPNKDLTIADGALLPVEPAAPRGLRLPVDRFFRELAQHSTNRSVGVILSGMGSDGTLGLQAIKEHAGLVVVQDPAEAAFDGMPRSAIGSGAVDIVAPAAELPGRIIACVGAALLPPAAPPIDARQQSDINRVLGLLRARTGHDFSRYKKSSIRRRIDRRASIHQLADLAAYAAYVEQHPQELDLLFHELLIGVTSFFRDPAAWEFIKERVLPELLAAYPDGGTLRAWVPACSTGEEAYSLAIVFRELMDEKPPKARFAMHIFATDLDADAIDKARKALYATKIAADVGARRLKKYFQQDGTRFRIRADVRNMVTFAQQDVLLDPPFTKLDFLSCRNLLIYLGTELQKKLTALFHYSLNAHGVLFLGSAETVSEPGDGFAPLHPKLRLFRRRDTRRRAGQALDLPAGRFPISPPVGEVVKAPRATANLVSLADHALLQRIGPAAVLVTEGGDIVYVNGRTGKYLEPATGQANWNVHAMAREGLRGALAGALRKASRQRGRVRLPDVVVDTDGGTQAVDISVESIDEPAELRDMLLILFTESPAVTRATTPARARRTRAGADAREIERALRQARDERRQMYEDMQTTQEELKSANEELQSTNEELTTSKEEMQSMNEELQTVNAELQSKVDELTRTSNDMKNLLESTDIATVFLDAELRIRRFTTHATELFKLLPGDVQRPLSDIVSQLDYPLLERDALEVLRTLVYQEKQIPTADGRWFKVRIMPYRTVDNRIDGVVITFSNITEHKVLESQLRRDGHAQ